MKMKSNNPRLQEILLRSTAQKNAPRPYNEFLAPKTDLSPILPVKATRLELLCVGWPMTWYGKKATKGLQRAQLRGSKSRHRPDPPATADVSSAASGTSSPALS